MATILIVEDHFMSRKVLNTLFESTGHRVLEAENGWTALVLSRCHCPDLVIADVLLPAMDGVELAQKLRSLPSMEDTPVIFYTATSRLPEEIDLGEALGTCHVIPKPSDPRLILDVVNRVLGHESGNFSPSSNFAGSIPKPSVSSLDTGLQLAVLMDLSHSLVALRNPNQLLSVVSRAVREFLNCRHSLLLIEDEKGQKQYFLGGAEGEAENSCPAELMPPEDVQKRILTELTPLRYSSSHERPGSQKLIVPFSTPTRTFGWISLQGKLDNSGFSSGDEEAAMTLSVKAALAYENILLVEKLQEKEKYLEKLVDDRTAELEQAKTELLTMQKLESLGVLAGGIAHNFNNALTAIIGHTQLAKLRSNPKDKIFRSLELAEKACFDAQSLTRQLLTFAKGGKPLKKVISLEDCIRDTADFILRNSPVRCHYNLARNLHPVKADQGQVGQVLSNLLLNALQAMPDGGSITIDADNVSLDSNTSLSLPAGNYVRVSVKDTGVGIAQEDLHRIFDPYYTTKDKGTGLGLATAYSIIKNHGGLISAESQEGRGSVFHIFLPATPDFIVSTQESSPQEVKNGGRILLIEDNDFIAQSLAELLELNGFDVDFVGDGAEGLKLFSQSMEQDRKYHAVIMDLTIPGGMGGKETIKHLREMDPDVVAIVISGYSNDPVLSNYRQYGFNGTFAKPFNYKEIICQLQRLINS